MMTSSMLQNVDVLIAEDNDSNFMLVKAILKGYNVDRAKNGFQAVEMASKKNYDLILMDIVMPEMDGLTATRLIRSTNKNIPIIALSANVFESDIDKAYDAGCLEFIAKPLNQKLFWEVVKRVCPDKFNGR